MHNESNGLRNLWKINDINQIKTLTVITIRRLHYLYKFVPDQYISEKILVTTINDSK
jgi:hypothetical protein